MLCGIAVPAVTYGDVWGMRSLPQIFFGMTHLATLLRSLGSAKLVRRSWICERTVILSPGALSPVVSFRHASAEKRPLAGHPLGGR